MIVRRFALALTALALLCGFAASSAHARTRIQTVAGWQIVREDESGDRTVYLRRHRRFYRFDFTYEYWRGNGGVSTMATFERGACRSGGTGAIVPFAEGMSRRFLDTHVTEFLRECPLPRAETRAVRATLSAAWPRLVVQLRRAKADMDAEIREIENYGR